MNAADMEVRGDGWNDVRLRCPQCGDEWYLPLEMTATLRELIHAASRHARTHNTGTGRHTGPIPLSAPPSRQPT